MFWFDVCPGTADHVTSAASAAGPNHRPFGPYRSLSATENDQFPTGFDIDFDWSKRIPGTTLGMRGLSWIGSGDCNVIKGSHVHVQVGRSPALVTDPASWARLARKRTEADEKSIAHRSFGPEC